MCRYMCNVGFAVRTMMTVHNGARGNKMYILRNNYGICRINQHLRLINFEHRITLT